MPVERFRSVQEMPPTPVNESETMAQRLKRIQRVWSRAAALAPKFARRRGVYRYRSLEEAQQDREHHSARNAKRD